MKDAHQQCPGDNLKFWGCILGVSFLLSQISVVSTLGNLNKRAFAFSCLLLLVTLLIAIKAYLAARKAEQK